MTPPPRAERIDVTLLPCPFCNAAPNQGLTKIQYDQLHGEPFQRFEVWCPHHCARINRVNREQSIAAWNTRAHAAPAGEVKAYAEKLAECLAKACGDIAALLTFGNREGDIRPWTAEYAAVLNAYDGKYETPAYPRPSWQASTHSAPPADVGELVEALEPFAKCCEQIADDEVDEEWAKFRLLIKDYRRARAALAKHTRAQGEG